MSTASDSKEEDIPDIIEKGTVAGRIHDPQKSRLVKNLEAIFGDPPKDEDGEGETKDPMEEGEKEPNAFSNKGPESYDNSIAFVDIAMVLRSRLMKLNETNLVKTPRDIPVIIKKLCEYFVECTKVGTSVMAFDKGRLVRDTKKQEQISRYATDQESKKRKNKDEDFVNGSRQKKEKAPSRFPPKQVAEDDGIPHTDERKRPYITLYDDFPHDWDDSLSNRLGTLPHITRLICCWLLGYQNDEPCGADAGFSIPVGTRIIIDGHCLKLEDIENLGIDLPDIGVKWDNERLYGTPVCYEHAKTKPFIRRYLMPELFNSIGEADESMACLHYGICKMDNHVYDMVVVSWDTDLLLNSLAYCDRFKRMLPEFGNDAQEPRIFLKRDSPEWVFFFRTPNKNNSKWIDINLLHEQISTYEGLEDSRYPVWSVICALVMGGGDYTYNFHMVTHERFLTGILDYFGDIGELVELEEVILEEGSKKRKPAHGIAINPTAVRTLIKIAYILGMPKGEKKEKLLKSPGLWTMDDVREAHKNYVEKRRVPGPKTLELRTLQTLLKMIYMVQIGCDVQYEPDPYKYGYVEGIDPRNGDHVPLKKKIRITE